MRGAVSEGSYRRWSLSLVLLASLAAGWTVYVTRLVPSGLFRWDEAAHALRGLLIARDVQEHDWLAFCYDSYRQVYWPPLHSWLTGAAFLVQEPTTMVARSVSLIAFVLLGPTLFFSGRELARSERNLVGAVAAAFVLTSPPIAEYAATAMIECSALLAFCLTLLVFMRLGRAGVSPRAHLLLGLMVTITYFFKGNYGILLLFAILFTRLVEADFRPHRLRTRANGYAIAPVVLLGVAWFAYPPKIVSTLHALVNQPWGGSEARGVAGLLFYPKAFLRFSGSVGMLLLFLASLAASSRQLRDPNVRLLLVLAIGQFLIGTLHHTKVDRHLLPVLPAFYLLTALATVMSWIRFAEWKVARLVAAGALAGLLAINAKTAFSPPIEPSVKSWTEGIVEYVGGLVGLARPGLVLGAMGAAGPPIVDWHLIVDEQLLAVTRAGSVSDSESERRIAPLLTRAPSFHGLRDELLRVLTRYDEGVATRSFYLGLPIDIDAKRFDAWLQRTLAARSSAVW